jgi:hypothetical protein
MNWRWRLLLLVMLVVVAVVVVAVVAVVVVVAAAAALVVAAVTVHRTVLVTVAWVSSHCSCGRAYGYTLSNQSPTLVLPLIHWVRVPLHSWHSAHYSVTSCAI